VIRFQVLQVLSPETLIRTSLLLVTCIVKTLQGHDDNVTALIEAKESMLISGSIDKTIRLWNLNDTGLVCKPCKTITNINQSKVYFHALCLIDDNTFAAGSDNDINIYNLSQSFEMAVQKTLKGHNDFVFTIQVTNNKEALISVSADKTCKAWSIITGECLRTFIGHSGLFGVYGLVMLSDTLYVTSSTDIKFWDLNLGTCLNTIEQNQEYIRHLAITQDLRMFSCGSDTKVRIYKI